MNEALAEQALKIKELKYESSTIDTILVNPSEEERIRENLRKHGLAKYANAVTPCIYIPIGQMLLYDSSKQMKSLVKCEVGDCSI